MSTAKLAKLLDYKRGSVAETALRLEGPDGRVHRAQGVPQGVVADTEGVEADAVEALGVLPHGIVPAGGDIVEDGQAQWHHH